ncbi:hypothetical protein DPMN_137895 [Dreissena polymorpha]|uniref:Uncharacterized protein n=1 Tax=Dreissena polymorpha TaxID=45954 RepID=A0A9D4G8R2_DREPO|nr:hypothetical protein DPMN_137895 [Dreissena polymorpha]
MVTINRGHMLPGKEIEPGSQTWDGRVPKMGHPVREREILLVQILGNGLIQVDYCPKFRDRLYYRPD